MELDVNARLTALMDEGWAIWEHFDRTVREKRFHSFIASDYGQVLETLTSLREPGLRFLEWGSANGVITIMADLLGFEAHGIEQDPALVDIARAMADKYDSRATFTLGSFVPAGYRWTPPRGDGRPGVVGDGTSAYPRLGRPLEDFAVVFAYPWPGEEPMMQNLMATYGAADARLLLHGTDGVRIHERTRPGERGRS